MSKEVDLHVDADGEYMSVVLTQGEDAVCAIAGRPLTKTEKGLPLIE